MPQMTVKVVSRSRKPLEKKNKNMDSSKCMSCQDMEKKIERMKKNF